MPVRKEVIPFLAAALLLGAASALLCRLLNVPWPLTGTAAGLLTALLSGYFLYFFRDPPRTPPADPQAIVAGADGRVARIVTLSPEELRQRLHGAGLRADQVGALGRGAAVRFSIFLSLFDVHVNRAPISGAARFLGYFPGRHFFTFQEKSSDHNQHNSILIENENTCCLFNQIVGPVCRRVVYWPAHDRPVPVKQGEPIGMMKFGSRLDLYFPAETVRVAVREGDRVRAGETVIAAIRGGVPA